MVILSEDQLAITPLGRPDEMPIPVAPEVVCMIFVSDVFIHNIGSDEGELTVLSKVIEIIPLAYKVSHPPVNGMR